MNYYVLEMLLVTLILLNEIIIKEKYSKSTRSKQQFHLPAQIMAITIITEVILSSKNYMNYDS